MAYDERLAERIRRALVSPRDPPRRRCSVALHSCSAERCAAALSCCVPFPPRTGLALGSILRMRPHGITVRHHTKPLRSRELP